MNYPIVILRDVSTNGEPLYVAFHPDLDGCAAQGESMQEARENLTEFYQDYIQHLIDHALPVPEPSALNGLCIDFAD